MFSRPRATSLFMKTITEFSPSVIKSASRIRVELAASGKTPEEIPAGLGEALKMEGDKLTHFMWAIEVVAEKTADLKRVLVFSVAEGEKAPSSAKEKNGVYFMVEYYPPLNPPGGRGKPQDGRSAKDDGKRRGGKRGERGGRSDDKRGKRDFGGRAPAPAEGGDRPKRERGDIAGGQLRPPRGEPREAKPLTVPKVKEGFVKKPTPPEAIEAMKAQKAAEAEARAKASAEAAERRKKKREEKSAAAAAGKASETTASGSKGASTDNASETSTT